MAWVAERRGVGKTILNTGVHNVRILIGHRIVNHVQSRLAGNFLSNGRTSVLELLLVETSGRSDWRVGELLRLETHVVVACWALILLATNGKELLLELLQLLLTLGKVQLSTHQFSENVRIHLITLLQIVVDRRRGKNLLRIRDTLTSSLTKLVSV